MCKNEYYTQISKPTKLIHASSSSNTIQSLFINGEKFEILKLPLSFYITSMPLPCISSHQGKCLSYIKTFLYWWKKYYLRKSTFLPIYILLYIFFIFRFLDLGKTLYLKFSNYSHTNRLLFL